MDEDAKKFFDDLWELGWHMSAVMEDHDGPTDLVERIRAMMAERIVDLVFQYATHKAQARLHMAESREGETRAVEAQMTAMTKGIRSLFSEMGLVKGKEDIQDPKVRAEMERLAQSFGIGPASDPKCPRCNHADAVHQDGVCHWMGCSCAPVSGNTEGKP